MKKKTLRVSVIIPTWNVERSLPQVLRQLMKQDYPILEIILIDNVSSDDTVKVARKFIAKHPRHPIRLIQQKENLGISNSYNVGARAAKGDCIVSLHSDGVLPTRHELAKLMKPFENDPSVIAAGPIALHPKSIWLTYNFWQKCLFARDIDKRRSTGNGKFDCYNRKAFLSIGGFDTKHFRHTVGTEDADMYVRLSKIGMVKNTSAEVIHAHAADPHYSLGDWVARRQFLSLSYGRYLQMHGHETLGGKSAVVGFFLKPAVAFFSLFGFMYPPLFIPLMLFPFIYMPRMFLESSTLKDVRIFALPFILIFLVYYETFWMFWGLLFLKK